MKDFTLFRTGRAYSASHEYFVKYPDGFQTNIWSPPWNEFESFEEEDQEAKKVVKALWNMKLHKENVSYNPDDGSIRDR